MSDASGTDPRILRDQLVLQPRPALTGATLIAITATAGSLYLSLGLGLIPCRLCWYQRILMYPLVVVLGIATVEGNGRIYRTVLPLSTFGAGIAAYHSLLQLSASGGNRCTVGGCSNVQLRVVGLSIPNLSLLAFVLITAAMLVVAIRRP